ncbi:hypothetical protein FHL15_007087 [Xylaria flabelliformis]|uniref:LysM domain-containing protein n=1 Tax=Xylaria flabelliformis TaxID=2512241 RepID=A0A553HVK4_9PEZI|nr:hypothetical protein FHL15_007087 [Xylaria flabelliformis]
MRIIQILTAAVAAVFLPLASASDPVNNNPVNNNPVNTNGNNNGLPQYSKVVPPPGPVQPGALVDKCGGWVEAVSGTTCYGLAKSLGIDDLWLRTLNPQLKGDCSKNLWAGYYYCKGLVGSKSPFHSISPSPSHSQPKITDPTFYTTLNSHSHSHPKPTDPPPPPPRKSPDSDCIAAHLDQCASAVFTASATPGPMINWCKRYLSGPKCTEARPEAIFRSYDKFPRQADASSLCAYPSAPPMAPRFSTACRSPAADLRPAPLRIPVRKTVTSSDDNPRAIVSRYRQRTRDTSTSTLSRERPSQYSHSDITRTLPNRRQLGPKLQSLKSRFEILHAVNSAEISASHHSASSYKAWTSAIPRAANSKQNLQRNLLSPSPVESVSRASTELSPRQIRTPAATGRKSMLPVSKQSITKISDARARGHPDDIRKSPCRRVADDMGMDIDDQQTSRPSTSYFTSHSTVSVARCEPRHDPSVVVDRRKLFEENCPQSPCVASTIPTLRHARPFITPRGTSTYRLPKSKSFRSNSPSIQPSSSDTALISPLPETEFSPKKAAIGKYRTLPRMGEGSKSPAFSTITHSQQRQSVSDLRKSFEKFSQPVKASGVSTRPSLHPKISRRSIRHNRDMSPSTSSKLRIELLAEPPSMSPAGTSSLRPPIIGKGQVVNVRPRTKAVEQISLSNSIEGSGKHGPSPTLPKSRRFLLQTARQEKIKVSREPVGLEPFSPSANEKTSPEWGNGDGLEISMDGLSNVPFSGTLSNAHVTDNPRVQCEQFVTENTPNRSVLGIFRTPKVLLTSDRPTQGSGKVSRLRRFFEQSPSLLSSPLSLMSFRSRPAEKLQEDYPLSPGHETGSLTSVNTITRRRSMVPSLTTEISVNDFFCDFVGDSNGETPILLSPSETVVEKEAHVKCESPVKHRIQQFEHISRDSLKVGPSDKYHGKDDNTELSSAFKTGYNNKDKRNIVGGWKPIHQKGAAIWRKISNSFSRSLDSWKDCDSDHEHLNPTEGIGSDTDFDRSPSPADYLRHHIHHPSSFRYSMDHDSHTSPQLVSSSQTARSIRLGVRSSSNLRSRQTSKASYDCSSPHTPLSPQIFRKRFPLVARVYSGLSRPNAFGLDGHFPSKPVREEESQPSEAGMSSPSTPQGDPNALLKVMLKQSAAERNRRRHDEKHLHLRRDIKLRTLALWKGKGKADVNLHSADGTILNRETGKKQDKGKGKGKEKENGNDETNKKTESGFVIFESKDVKLRHPKPRRPGQVRKLANMYRDKGSSGVSVNTKTSSGVTLKESRPGFRQKASSAFGLRGRKEKE